MMIDDHNINFDLKDESLMNLMNVEGGSQMVTLKKKQFDAMTRKKKGLNRMQQEMFQKKLIQLMQNGIKGP
jgi:hypothetical protein